MTVHFDFVAPLRVHRSTRQHDRACWAIFRALEARRDDITPGGAFVDMPARAPRQQRSATSSCKTSDDSGSDDGTDGPGRPKSIVKLYRISDAAEQLSISRATLYRMVATGSLKLVKIGANGSRITAESIDALLATNG
jgi:excisionase family DNA binding protein